MLMLMRRHVTVGLLLWMLKWFSTGDALVAYLNTLTPEQQASAKVMVAPSTRNVLGWVGEPYGLLYEKHP